MKNINSQLREQHTYSQHDSQLMKQLKSQPYFMCSSKLKSELWQQLNLQFDSKLDEQIKNI